MADGSVSLAGNKVTGELQRINLADLAVNAQKLEDLAVEAGKLAPSSVTATKIANLAVGTAAIANAAITNAKIGNLAVDTAQIANAAIDSAKIANLAVGTAAVQDAAIVNAKINNLAVTDAKIQDVTAAKITTGTLLATETITREGVIRAVDDINTPTVQTGIGPATFGTATTYLMWAYNGTDRTFSVDELGNVSVTGSITIAAGSTGVANLSDAGTLAGKNSADWDTEVAGTGKPADDATVGAVWGSNISGQPAASVLENSFNTASSVGADPSGSASDAEAAAKDYTDAVVKKLATNAYAGTVDADGYATGDKVPSLIFELFGTSSWPESYGGVVTHWYAAERATQICFGTSGDVEYTREVHPGSYPNWSSWKKKEVYNSSDVNSLLTLNGPAQAGADVTDYAAAAATAQQNADDAQTLLRVTRTSVSSND